MLGDIANWFFSSVKMLWLPGGKALGN